MGTFCLLRPLSPNSPPDLTLQLQLLVGCDLLCSLSPQFSSPQRSYCGVYLLNVERALEFIQERRKRGSKDIKLHEMLVTKLSHRDMGSHLSLVRTC